MRWDLITQQKSSVLPLNQYRARPGTRSRLMFLYAPREIVAAAFKWRWVKHGISMTQSFLRWLGWFHEGSEWGNWCVLIVIQCLLHPLKGLFNWERQKSLENVLRYFILLLDIFSIAGKPFLQLKHSVSPRQDSGSSKIMQGGQGWEPTLALMQWTWTYWVSSGTRIGWGRLWRPPHRRAAGVTGSGRSVRKTGRRVPSARSGYRLSDCFLETHTYIYKHRRAIMGRLASSIHPPLSPKSTDETAGNRNGRPPAKVENGGSS